jgi:hypothetical protein
MTQVTANVLSVDDAPPAAPSAACEACGAPLDPLDRFCGACGTPQQPVATAVKAPAPPVRTSDAGSAGRRGAATEDDRGGEEAPAQKFFRCKNCGAEVATDPGQRSYVCAFCDSTYVVEFSPELASRKQPEFVLPFVITPEKGVELFQKWIASNHLFRPGDLRTARIEEKLKGVYLPFWSFSMLLESQWRADIGEYWYRTETYTTVENGKTVTRTRRVQETEWWPARSGNHHNYYSGYLVSASRGLPQQEAEGIKPFQLAALRRYSPAYLAGWLCEEYSIDRESAEQICRTEFLRQEDAAIRAFLPGDTYRDFVSNTQFSQVNEDLILLPLYVLSYRYRDKLYRFMINGQTGKVEGDKPISWPRIWVAVALAVVAVAIFLILAGAFGR